MVSRLQRGEPPKLTFHKASGQGVVRLNGRDIYCGRFGSPECQVKYHRVIAEWLANGRRLPAPSAPVAGQAPEDITVNELALAYFEHAEQYYRKDGEPTTEVRDIRYSIRPLRKLYGMTLARDFG